MVVEDMLQVNASRGMTTKLAEEIGRYGTF